LNNFGRNWIHRMNRHPFKSSCIGLQHTEFSRQFQLRKWSKNPFCVWHHFQNYATMAGVNRMYKHLLERSEWVLQYPRRWYKTDRIYRVDISFHGIETNINNQIVHRICIEGIHGLPSPKTHF
jgi:hypothetical protein